MYVCGLEQVCPFRQMFVSIAANSLTAFHQRNIFSQQGNAFHNAKKKQ